MTLRFLKQVSRVFQDPDARLVGVVGIWAGCVWAFGSPGAGCELGCRRALGDLKLGLELFRGTWARFVGGLWLWGRVWDSLG